MTNDLFAAAGLVDPPQQIMAEGAVLLRGAAITFERETLTALESITVLWLNHKNPMNHGHHHGEDAVGHDAHAHHGEDRAEVAGPRHQMNVGEPFPFGTQKPPFGLRPFSRRGSAGRHCAQ